MSLTKDELKELIEKTVKQALTEQEKAKAAAQPQENHIDHTSHCPDCFSGLIGKMNQESDYVCRGCGLPLGNEAFMRKLETCPNCGSKGPARKVER
jgi:ribosomal protein L37E